MRCVNRLALIAMCVALGTAGCTSAIVRHNTPAIGDTIGKQSQPAVDVLKIKPSKPVAADPEKAIANYKALLKLDPDPKVRNEALRRIADLQVQVENLKGNPESGQATIEQSVVTYRNLLKQHPDAPDNDRLLYQLARAYENSGQSEQAVATLKRLETEYPGSDLMGDAHFRSAELLFQKKRYAAAARQYRIVMDLGPEAPFHQPAQYKYGWSLFKQQKYAEDIAVFFHILDTDLPPGKLGDPDTALAKVEKGRSDIAKDSLRVISLSFAALGGGPAINDYLARHGEPRFYELLYNALGARFLKHQRFTDAAKTYTAFIARYPKHADAPKFQDKVIAAYKAGGFNDEVLKATERYANDYAPGSDYWGKTPPSATVMGHLHRNFQAIGRHYQAKGDREKTAPVATRNKDFATAAHWYRRFLTVFPTDKDAPAIRMSLGDSLYDGAQTQAAAYAYETAAYAYPGYPHAPDAALAAVQAWQRLATEVPADQRAVALEMSVRSSRKLAETFPHHPKRNAVLIQAGANLVELKHYDLAARLANKALAAQPAPSESLQRAAFGVVGDSRFAQGNYPKAEAAYTRMLKLTPPDNTQRPRVVTQLALSIYRQGVAQRKLGNLRIAASDFLRIGKVVPDAELRPTADFDAAAAFIKLQDWPQAEQVLTGFRKHFPDHKLIPDVDKKLAFSYQSDHKPGEAAVVYQRIANRGSETTDTRRAAAWLAARLFDKAKQFANAQGAYEHYVGTYPHPLDRAMDARLRLSQLAKAQGDDSGYRYWLQNIVDADAGAGAERDDKSRSMAADASLALARMAVHQAKAIVLNQPLKDSLAAKKAAVQSAVQQLQKTLDYGIARDSTAATWELGSVYEDFAQSLLHSQRPAISGDALQQYNLLLEEKAEPFTGQAIKAHEANLAHVSQGLYDTWIAKSVAALAQLAPGTYAKQEKGKPAYEHLH